MKLPGLAWWGELAKGAARPICTYGCIYEFLAGVRDPAVTVDKLMVLAGVLGLLLGLRTVDKAISGRAAPQSEAT